ncbi:MAG: Flp pilus assembly protein CpaB [Alphaproteobacteria bacterium]|nr:Flp pilus assembly protein CpaB [Alphaproteobacteria bacterium]
MPSFNIRRFVGTAIALTLSALAAYMTHNLMKPKPAVPAIVRAAGPVVENQQVLVAAQDIAFGKRIAAEDLTWQAWPKANLSPRYVMQRTGVNAMTPMIGAIARSSFVKGEPILDQKLAHPKGGYMSSLLPAGMRAVAITTTPETSVNGFIMPGDFVDVIVTSSEKKDGADFYSGMKVLSAVQVLAIDDKVSAQTNANSMPGRTATLALNDAQAQALTTAQRLGTLSLVLRSSGEDDAQEKTTESCDTRLGHRYEVRIIRYGIALPQVNKARPC